MMNNHKTKIFITRKLSQHSPFEKLDKDKFQIIDRSLISFAPISFDKLPDTDCYFFYSQNGVKYLFDQIVDNQLEFLKQKKIVSIGPATANALRDYIQRMPDHIVELHIDEHEQILKSKLAKDSICFVQAQHSKQRFQNLFARSNVISLTTYSNIISEKIDVPNCDYYLVTSSLNAEALSKHIPQIGIEAKFISIGKPTNESLKKFGIKDSYIAPEATLDSLFNTLLKLL